MTLLGGPALLGFAWAALQIFSSRIIAQVATFGAAVLVARHLGPEAFGQYSFAVVSTTLIAVTSGAALDVAAVRLSIRDWPLDQPRARGVLLANLVLKSVVGLAALVLGLIAAELVAGPIGNRAELASPIRLAGVGALALCLMESTLATLQTRQQFGRIMLVNLMAGALRIVPMLVLASGQWLTLESAMLVFVAAAVGGCTCGAVLALPTWVGPRAWQRELGRELLTFSGWMTIGSVAGGVAGSLDVLILSFMTGAQTTGVYSSGRTLALPVTFASAAIGTVLLPRLGRISSPGQRRDLAWYLGQRVALVALVVTIVCVVCAPLAVPVIYDGQFISAVGVFQVLAAAYSVEMVNWVPATALMADDRPDLIAGLNTLLLVLTGVGLVIGVPTIGALGAAGALLVARLLVLVAYWALASQRPGSRAPIRLGQRLST